jgi:SAM-dependent methyltransferase
MLKALGRLARTLQPSESSDMGTAPSTLCVFCGANEAWRPYRGGDRSQVCEALQVIGSDVKNFWCPSCESHDRERHLLLFMRELGILPTAKDRVLHLAPEARLGELLRGLSGEYVTGVFVPGGSETLNVDIRQMPFEESTFDYVVANHILEHVREDSQSMSEVFRVLKPGGLAVLQTPFSYRLETSLENDSINDPDLRDLLFGEPDHVRVYGTDLFERLRSAGFLVEVLSHEGVLAKYDSAKYGVNVKEPFFKLTKPSV